MARATKEHRAAVDAAKAYLRAIAAAVGGVVDLGRNGRVQTGQRERRDWVSADAFLCPVSWRGGKDGNGEQKEANHHRTPMAIHFCMR